MILQNDIILYHGSYTEVVKPDINMCCDGKDFGKGFYLTTNKSQAERFVKSSVGKAVKNGLLPELSHEGYVSEYTFKASSKLSVYEFDNANREWLHCVAAHRKGGILPKELAKWEAYDVIVGKIANDNTNQVITAYINGLYGTVGSKESDAIAIQLLLPQKLTDQVCFRNKKALSLLNFVTAEKYVIK